MRLKKILSAFLSAVLVTTAWAMPVSSKAATAASTGSNPVIKGYYADPDIDWFDCKFWMFPTTDGIIDEKDGWWGSKTFKAFSSEDMVNWKDNGVILDVEADNAEEAGVNENGVQIAYSPWSYGHAWAPSIEKVGGKYYFYYVAAVKPELQNKYCAWIDEYTDDNGNIVKAHYVDDKAIGVAWANSPTGPYTALEEPLIYGKMIQDKFGNDKIPSVIDPSIFMDDDGSAYLTFGNWYPYIVKLNDDMMSLDESVFKIVSGIPMGWHEGGFMESLVIFKKDGKYYFTWSSNGTADENYCVYYATATKITNRVNAPSLMLKKDTKNGIYGTGHQSILYLPTNNTYYIAYGRLKANADGSLTDSADRGNYRECCIDKITFNEYNEASVKPTNKGVGKVTAHNLGASITKTKVKSPATTSADGIFYEYHKCKSCSKELYSAVKIKKISTIALYSTVFTYNGKAQKPTVIVKDSSGNKIPASYYSVTYTNNKNVGTATATIKFKGKYSGTVKRSFTIKPKGTQISKFTAVKGGVKVSWKNQSTQTSGYQIRYSTSAKMSGAKAYTIAKNTILSKTVTKLSKNKRYYFQVRSYKVVNGKKYYSSWSNVKSVIMK